MPNDVIKHVEVNGTTYDIVDDTSGYITAADLPVTDVKINNTSIVFSGSANIVTNTAYNASTNKIATMSDLSSLGSGTVTSVGVGTGLLTDQTNNSPITTSGSISLDTTRAISLSDIQTGTSTENKLISAKTIADALSSTSGGVTSITIGEETTTPDSSGDVDITWDINNAIEEYLDTTTPRVFIFEENGSEGNYIIKEEYSSGSRSDPLTIGEFTELYGYLSSGSGIIQQEEATEDGGFVRRAYYLACNQVEDLNSSTTSENKFICIEGSKLYTMSIEFPLLIVDGSPTEDELVTATLTVSTLVGNVRLNKQAENVLGENTIFYIVPNTKNVQLESAPTTSNFVTSISAESNKKLVTADIIGVESTTTTASKAVATTSQTTLDGTSSSSTTNTDWLKGISYANGVLTFGAATMGTQTTTQFTFDDVTVPIKASNSTTVATGSTSTDGTGDAVVTGVTVGSSSAAITSLPNMTINPRILADNNDIVHSLNTGTQLNISEIEASDGSAVVGTAIAGRSIIT